MADRYPRIARAHGLAGVVKLSCEVSREGRLTECQVLEESPAAQGFGAATQSLAKIFTLAPVDRDGAPSAGRTYVFKIEWRLSPNA